MSKKRKVFIVIVMSILIGCLTGVVFAEGGLGHKDGFSKEDGQTVYYQDGEKVHGFLTLGENTYYFDEENGYMVHGFRKIEDNTYYFYKSSGKMAKGLRHIGPNTYYFKKKTGIMSTGFLTLDGVKYYFRPSNGRMVKGFLSLNGDKYYFDKETGAMLRGFQNIGDDTYYFFKSSGKMARGFNKIGKNTYYFYKSSGRMVRGFKKIGKSTYYFRKSNGRMVHGFKTISGKRYYFDPENGKMAKGLKTIGDYKYYFLKDSGHMKKGFLELDGNTYYFSKKNGHMLYGFHTISGKKYYFAKKSGKMFTGLHKIKGNVYTFKEDGVLVRTVYKDKKAICLTFDDGPSPNTVTIMNVLKEYGGRATFFCVGNRVGSYSDTLKKNYEMGNQIANHSWSHPILSKLSSGDIKDQVSSTNSKIKSVTGYTPKVMRTPYGERTENICSSVGLPIILWSVDTLDWKTQNADSTYNSIMNNARDGAVVLMHDLYAATASAVQRAVPALTNNGYQLVTVEEMALLKGVKLEKGKVYFSF